MRTSSVAGAITSWSCTRSSTTKTPRASEFYDTAASVDILHDYLVVLLKRQKAAAREKS